MDLKTAAHVKIILAVVTVVAVLQAVAIGLGVYYGTDSLRNDRLLVENSQNMRFRVVPEMRRSLSSIQGNSSELVRGVTSLRGDVNQMGSVVSKIDARVSGVDRRLEAVHADMDRFFNEKGSWLWGHSLNPYLLLGLLALLLLNLPLCAWILVKIKQREAKTLEAPVNLSAERISGLDRRLDELFKKVELVKAGNADEERLASELRSLMEQTGEVLREAKTDLAQLLRIAKTGGPKNEQTPDRIH